MLQWPVPPYPDPNPPPARADRATWIEISPVGTGRAGVRWGWGYGTSSPSRSGTPLALGTGVVSPLTSCSRGGRPPHPHWGVRRPLMCIMLVISHHLNTSSSNDSCVVWSGLGRPAWRGMGNVLLANFSARGPRPRPRLRLILISSKRGEHSRKSSGFGR